MKFCLKCNSNFENDELQEYAYASFLEAYNILHLIFQKEDIMCVQNFLFNINLAIVDFKKSLYLDSTIGIKINCLC